MRDARKFSGNPDGKTGSPWRTLIEQSKLEPVVPRLLRVISPSRRSLAGQAENNSESMINVMAFVARQQTVRLSQAAGVYGVKLFD